MKYTNDSALWKNFTEAGRLEKVSVIDVHTHMGDINDASTPVFEIDECVGVMDERNIDSIWCAPHYDLFDVDEPNRYIEEYMAKYPERVKGYFSFNPNYCERYIKRIERVDEIDNYIGFKFLPVYHNVSLADDRYKYALDFAEKRNLVVLSHTWGGTACSPAEVAELLKKYKNLQFILGHSSPNQLDDAIELVKKHDNAYLDLCDIHRHSGIVDKMCENVGAEKVLFGTDFPWYEFNYCIGSVLCAHISDDKKELIFRGNAERIFKNIKKAKGVDL